MTDLNEASSLANVRNVTNHQAAFLKHELGSVLQDRIPKVAIRLTL